MFLLFNTCMDWVLGRVVNQSHCGESAGNTKITDYVFADDAIIFAESLDVLVVALKTIHEKTKLLRHQISSPKNKIRVIGGVLDETLLSIHACGEDILISWKASHTVLAKFITMVDHIKKF